MLICTVLLKIECLGFKRLSKLHPSSHQVVIQLKNRHKSRQLRTIFLPDKADAGDKKAHWASQHWALRVAIQRCAADGRAGQPRLYPPPSSRPFPVKSEASKSRAEGRIPYQQPGSQSGTGQEQAFLLGGRWMEKQKQWPKRPGILTEPLAAIPHYPPHFILLT